MKRKQTGFTLVEIAIVLVIIGLLLGGILKGQEMITQAKIKNVIADFSGISAAYHGYQDRYRAIPGDDPNAATRWTTARRHRRQRQRRRGRHVQQRQPGVRSRRVPPVVGSPAPRRLRVRHRRAAAVQRGDGDPRRADRRRHALAGAGPAVGVGGFSGLIICSANLPDKIAIAADTQMDDGVPTTARCAASCRPRPIRPSAPSPTGAYAEIGTNVYTLCRAL